MINNKKVLAVIPARGGSKGLSRKNIRMLAGRPLIAWTIRAAKKSKYIDRLVLSSEDEEIIQTSRAFGCEVPFIRPADLAKDDTPGIEPILHAINELPGFDLVIVLQPTSPLRTDQDIDCGLEFFEQQLASVCVSVSLANKNPYWMFSMDQHFRLHPVIKQRSIAYRRQDLPEVYIPNGALFIGNIDCIISNKSFYTDESIGYIIPSQRAHDIDNEQDLLYVETLLNSLKTENGKTSNSCTVGHAD